MCVFSFWGGEGEGKKGVLYRKRCISESYK